MTSTFPASRDDGISMYVNKWLVRLQYILPEVGRKEDVLGSKEERNNLEPVFMFREVTTEMTAKSYVCML